jgi:hypothetical protein
MTQAVRAWVGFVVAPGAPAVLLYLWELHKGYGDAAVVAPGLLVPFGYVGALVIGWPTYIILQRRGNHGFGAYIALGALIGAVVVVVMESVGALGQDKALQYTIAQFWVTVRFAVIAAIYAMIASAVFWLIAVRSQSVSRDAD